MFNELPVKRGSRILPITNCINPIPPRTIKNGTGEENCIKASIAGKITPSRDPTVGM